MRFILFFFLLTSCNQKVVRHNVASKMEPLKQHYNSHCCKCDNMLHLLLQNGKFFAYIEINIGNKNFANTQKFKKIDSNFVKVEVVEYETDSIYNAPCSDIYLTNAIKRNTFKPDIVYSLIQIVDSDSLRISLKGTFISEKSKIARYFCFLNKTEIIGDCVR